jgi:hypothetical protein
MWMVGVALSALLVAAARDVGRSGRASEAGLAGLRTLGGLGLGVMAVLALSYGRPAAAAVAAVGAAPLIVGLMASERRRLLARRPVAVAGSRIAAARRPAQTQERRAA